MSQVSIVSPAPTAGSHKPLRVLHLNSMLTGGGTDDQCVRLVEALTRSGQSVVLAGPAGRTYSAIAQERGLQFTAMPAQKLPFILAAAKLIRRLKVQIVHGHHGRDLWPTILSARISGRRPKIVLTRHMAKSPGSLASRLLLLRECDALIAVSDFVASVLREGAHEPASDVVERRHRPPLLGDHSKIRVIHNGLDTERFHPADAKAQREAWGVTDRDFVFGVAGGYDLPRGKGQREFLQAATRIHHLVPAARFLVIGRGNMASILQSDIARFMLNGKAWLTPYCDDMPAAMNALDCLVHPQVGTEAFGMVLVEAFACGKPVIASRLDGIPEAFEAGGVGELVPPGSVDALAEAMLRWANRPALTCNQQQELHRRVEARFSWPACAQNVVALYRHLVD